MRFSCEEAQTAFHLLPTQTQLDWLEIEEKLSELGYTPEIRFRIDGSLEVCVGIYEQPKLRPISTED